MFQLNTAVASCLLRLVVSKPSGFFFSILFFWSSLLDSQNTVLFPPLPCIEPLDKTQLLVVVIAEQLPLSPLINTRKAVKWSGRAPLLMPLLWKPSFKFAREGAWALVV
jgi:hypothetical protein